MRLQTFSIYIFALFLTGCKSKEIEQNSSEEYTLNAPIYFGNAIENKNNPLTEDGINLGRHLFYEKSLSIDSTISCSSCHLQKHGFSDTLQFSKGVNGKITKRKSMGLSNLAWQTNFFWEGRATSLEQQAINPIESEDEMNLNREEAVSRLNQNPLYRTLCEKAFNTTQFTPDLIAKAIAQFERTIVSGQSKYDLYKHGKATLTPSELRGENLFFTHPDPANGLRGGNCGDCHTGGLTTNNKFSNNGLQLNTTDIGREKVTKNPKDRGKFKVVSLRNIALHPPFMHDGRFNTLNEVLDHYNEHIQESEELDPQISQATNSLNSNKLDLTTNEKKDIIAFLHTLTDNSLSNNEKLSNPFK